MQGSFHGGLQEYLVASTAGQTRRRLDNRPTQFPELQSMTRASLFTSKLHGQLTREQPSLTQILWGFRGGSLAKM